MSILFFCAGKSSRRIRKGEIKGVGVTFPHVRNQRTKGLPPTESRLDKGTLAQATKCEWIAAVREWGSRHSAMPKPLRRILKVLLTFTEVVVCNQITCLSMKDDHPIDLSNRPGWSFFMPKTLPTFADMIVYVYRPHASYAFPFLGKKSPLLLLRRLLFLCENVHGRGKRHSTTV